MGNGNGGINPGRSKHKKESYPKIRGKIEKNYHRNIKDYNQKKIYFKRKFPRSTPFISDMEIN